jgi:hypothetical protein
LHFLILRPASKEDLKKKLLASAQQRDLPYCYCMEIFGPDLHPACSTKTGRKMDTRNWCEERFSGNSMSGRRVQPDRRGRRCPRRYNFDGDITLEVFVVFAIHDSHAACANLLLDSIERQSVPDHPAPQQDQVTSYSIAKRTEANGSVSV